MIPLDKPLKRSLVIDGRDYVITIHPAVLKVTQKGRRLGLELKWTELIGGETALAVALQASVGKFQSDPSPPRTTTPAPKRVKKAVLKGDRKK